MPVFPTPFAYSWMWQPTKAIIGAGIAANVIGTLAMLLLRRAEMYRFRRGSRAALAVEPQQVALG
jgi:hypothetical protein